MREIGDAPSLVPMGEFSLGFGPKGKITVVNCYISALLGGEMR
jgi:hypothetical protein